MADSFADIVVDCFAACRYVERVLLDTAVQRTLTPSPYVYATEITLVYLINGYTNYSAYETALWRGWGWIQETIDVEGQPVLRYQVNVPRINALTVEWLLGNASLCMPYTGWVNYLNSPVLVPPPC